MNTVSKTNSISGIFGGSAVNQDRVPLWGKQLGSPNSSFIGGAFSNSGGNSVNQSGFGGFQSQQSPPRSGTLWLVTSVLMYVYYNT